MKYKLLILFSLFLIVLSGCKPPSVYKQKTREVWREHEAKLYDIPIMLNAQPEQINTPNDTNQFALAYAIRSTLDEVQKFYVGQMERFGWQLHSSFEANERLLVFEKPSKLCSISLRSHKDQTKVVIFYRMKRSPA